MKREDETWYREMYYKISADWKYRHSWETLPQETKEWYFDYFDRKYQYGTELSKPRSD